MHKKVPAVRGFLFSLKQATKNPDFSIGIFMYAEDFGWSWKRDSNTRPAHYECAALPTELFQHILPKKMLANNVGMW